jgi:hypothetical protein
MKVYFSKISVWNSIFAYLRFMIKSTLDICPSTAKFAACTQGYVRLWLTSDNVQLAASSGLGIAGKPARILPFR